MTNSLQTLGRSVGSFVEDRLRRNPSEEGPPTIRLKGFLEGEIPYIIEALATNDDLVLPGHDHPPTIVVGRRGGLNHVGEEHLLSDDRTLTWHRNNNHHGLIIIELDAQSDEQGLTFIDTLADNDVFRDPNVRSHRIRTITATSWRVAGAIGEVPGVLLSESVDLFEHLAQLSIPSLRRWVEFVDVVVDRLARSRRAVTGIEVRNALAEHLQHLRFFPDDALFDHEASAARRLERNFHLAALRTPQGREVRTEDLESRIDTVALLDHERTLIQEPDLSEIRAAMHAILDGGGVEELSQVPLRLWEQLFERREPAIGLGAQIHEYLEQQHLSRVAEYDGLEVEAGLDDGDAEAAEVLLRADEGEEDVPLADLLRRDLRRRVERLVFSGEQESADPLKTILYGIQALDFDEFQTADETERASVLLQWERLREDEGVLSARLFAFLYGPTLLQAAADSDSGLGIGFAVDPLLTTTGSLAPEETAESEGEDVQEWLNTAWAPLRLTLRMNEAGTPLLRFRWSPEEHPGLVGFARLVHTSGVEAAYIEDLDTFVSGAMDVFQPLPLTRRTNSGSPNEHTERWRLAFDRASAAWTQYGLTIDSLDTFLSEWFEILAEAREALVPRGEPLRGLDAFLDRDICSTSAGTWVMLPTHPMRLRWLYEHLSVMRTWLVQALAGELHLNAENDGLFFDWVDNVSPHRQPAIISPADRVLATAAREKDWYEEYVPVDSASSLGREAVLDDSSVEELVAACRQFLHSYPHKTDGISVLLMLRGNDTRTPAVLLNRLLQRDLADIVVSLHVLAPRSNHERIARSLRDFDQGHGRGVSMFPRLQLMLHAWDADVPTALGELRGRVDVALAPNLFGVDIDPLTETRARSEGVSGHYDPWLDATSHVRSGGGVNVARVMLPARPDPVSEAWSTLTVRRHRRAVVKFDDPSSTDFVTLQIRFDANRRLFEQLHSVAHWVVTLDPFVGRDQIDSLDQRPDIILVKEGVGKNETYTLVISSSAGRLFVTQRLRRRLTNDLEFSDAESKLIADRLYDAGRDVCPGLMLRALGLGRSTEEILGLVSARYVCDRHNASQDDGIEFWLSLDELAHWFGGSQRSRPDLLRVRLTKTDGGAKLDFLVLESKFRRSLDLSIADQQLDAGVALLRSAFVTDDSPADDGRFWRRELHRAYRQLSRPDRQASDLPAVLAIGRGLSDAEVDQLLLGGEFVCDSVDSLAVAVSWNEDEIRGETQTPGGHALVAISRQQLRELLVQLRKGQAAAVTSTTDAPASDEALTGATQDRIPPDSPIQGSERADEAAEGAEDYLPRGLGRDGRESQYQRLLDRLDSLGVSVTRAEPAHTEGPRFSVYRVVPDASVPLDRVVGRTQELKLALGLPSDQFVRAYVDRGSVVFEVPKEDEHSFVVAAEDLWGRTREDADALAVPIGVDVSDRVVEVNFSSSDTPHLLIAGQTGAGKSVALETLLTGLCRRKTGHELRLHLVDPKGTELLDLADDPHVEGEIGFLPEDALTVLSAGVAEMERRYGIFRSHRARSLPQFNDSVPEADRLPWWLIVLDEYADLTSDPDDKKAIEAEVRRIAQKGRASGVHLIVATQRPSADVIGTVIRSNLPAQLALRVKSGTDSRLIIDEAGAETLAGKGDALLRTARGVTRIQCALVTGRDGDD